MLSEGDEALVNMGSGHSAEYVDKARNGTMSSRTGIDTGKKTLYEGISIAQIGR